MLRDAAARVRSWDGGLVARLVVVVALSWAAGALVAASGGGEAAVAQTTPAGAPADALRARLALERRAHRAEVRRLRRVVAADPDVRSALAIASVVYGVPERELRAVAFCESRFDPEARNPRSPASGLMQFYPSTYASTPFRRISLWNPYASALAAAWLVREDGWRQWACRP